MTTRRAHPSAWAATPLGSVGLPEPPADLAAGVEQLDDATWGTRHAAPALRGLGWYREELLSGRPVEDYVLAGYEEVSPGLVALHFLLVAGPVALFVQAAAERLSTGDPAPTEQGRSRLARAAAVQRAAVEATGAGRLAGGRLLVLETLHSGGEWSWTGGDPAPREGPDGLVGAQEWLAELAVLAR